MFYLSGRCSHLNESTYKRTLVLRLSRKFLVCMRCLYSATRKNLFRLEIQVVLTNPERNWNHFMRKKEKQRCLVHFLPKRIACNNSRSKKINEGCIINTTYTKKNTLSMLFPLFLILVIFVFTFFFLFFFCQYSKVGLFE